MRIYAYQKGERTGPHTLEEIQARLEACALSPTDLAWYEGLKDWVPLSQVPGLKLPESSAPPRLKLPPPLPVSTPPRLQSAASPALHSTAPPPRKGLLITCGIGVIVLAFVLFGVAVNCLGGQSDRGLPLLGILLIPASLGVGIVSIQFFCALSRNPTGCCKACPATHP